jgi:hypothetical protein
MSIDYADIRWTPWKVTVWGRLRQADADVRQALSVNGWQIRDPDAPSIDAVDPANPLMVAADAVVRETYQFIEKAESCLEPSGLFARLWDLLTGQLLMSAYLNLHMVECKRVLLFSAEQLTAELPAIRARVVAYLTADDARRVALAGVPDIYAPSHQALMARSTALPLTAVQRGALSPVVPAAALPAGQVPQQAAAPRADQVPQQPPAPQPPPAHDGAQPGADVQLTPMLGQDQRIASEALGAALNSEDDQQAQVRRFRGVLIGTFASLIIVVAILAIVGIFHAKLIPVCLPKAGAKAGTLVCPGGTSAPGAADLPLVLGLGAIGATLAVAKNLTGLKPVGVRYSLSVAQGMVKVTLGAITAVLGLLILQTQSNLPGVLGTQQALLASAVVFGYSQQIFTGLIDRQATSLQNAASPATPAQ